MKILGESLEARKRTDPFAKQSHQGVHCLELVDVAEFEDVLPDKPIEILIAPASDLGLA
ncbi:MAG: hypothetical protein WCQ50_14155 [Spirochaetota bacterium]